VGGATPTEEVLEPVRRVFVRFRR